MALSHKPHSGLPTLFSTLFLLALATTKVQSAPESVSFSFQAFEEHDERIIREGTAEILSNGTLALTNRQNPTWATGRALYYEPVPIWDSATSDVASFTTSFSFIVNSYPPAIPADGIVFFLKRIPPNSTSGGFGVVNADNFVGVEFDSYINDWDPNFPHIGINVNSLTSLRTVRWNRADGTLIKVSIIYNGPSKILSVSATHPNGEIATVAEMVDLKAVLPENVTVGLSASTTDCYEVHDIHNWSFTSTWETGENVNTASAT